MKRIVFLIVCCSLSYVLCARTFVHPGLLHTAEDLQRIKRLVENQTDPAYASYRILAADAKSSEHYRMHGPFQFISRAGQYGYTKTPCEEDFNAAYYQALMWVITGKESHADKSMEIIRAYAGRLEKIFGPDDPLCAGLQGFMFVNAAELMRYTYASKDYPRGWTDEDTKSVGRVLRTVFLPVLQTFVHSKPYANGNWGASVYKMLIATAVFLDDEPLYQQALDLFYHSPDNGSLANYIAPDGQIQESGRDQAHCMLGLGCLSEMAQVAWNQGDDLFAALDNRIMKGMEYLSKYNLGYDVPFHVWKDKTGRYGNWTTLGESGRGVFRSVFELTYNHYVYLKHIEMPYTQKVLGLIRPERQGFTCDNPGFGSLLFYLGKGYPTVKEGQIWENPMQDWNGWTASAVSWHAQGKQFLLCPPSLSISKRGVRYDSSRYPFIAVKISHLPSSHQGRWLRLSYSVNSAPEYWTLDEKEACRVDKDIYVFDIRKVRSNNHTPFSDRQENVTIELNFGQTNGEGVGIEWIRSVADLAEVKGK